MTASFDITIIEGAMWSIDIELDSFDTGSSGAGRYTVAGPDVPITAGLIGSEPRLDGNTGVPEGGSFGAVFEMDFGASEVLEGSFHVDLNLTTLEEEECWRRARGRPDGRRDRLSGGRGESGCRTIAVHEAAAAAGPG